MKLENFKEDGTWLSQHHDFVNFKKCCFEMSLHLGYHFGNSFYCFALVFFPNDDGISDVILVLIYQKYNRSLFG